jgi:hypothetical protein
MHTPAADLQIARLLQRQRVEQALSDAVTRPRRTSAITRNPRSWLPRFLPARLAS